MPARDGVPCAVRVVTLTRRIDYLEVDGAVCVDGDAQRGLQHNTRPRGQRVGPFLVTPPSDSTLLRGRGARAGVRRTATCHCPERGGGWTGRVANHRLGHAVAVPVEKHAVALALDVAPRHGVRPSLARGDGVEAGVDVVAFVSHTTDVLTKRLLIQLIHLVVQR